LATLTWADSGRFAPVTGGRSTEELVRTAERTVTELERALNAQDRRR
jgi:hypothetical protein